MTRVLVLLTLLLPGPTQAQGLPAAQASCAPVLPTVEADTLGPPSESGMGFYRVDGSPPSPRIGTAARLEFELRGAPVIRRGQPLNLSLRVTNRSRTPTTVMRSMDGSTEHMRDPSYDLYVREVGSTEIYRWDFHGGRCGMTNGVRPEDYVRIAPGSINTTLPGEWGTHLQTAILSAPGDYDAWLVYRLCGDISGGMSEPPAPGPAPSRGEYASNVVRLRVR